MSESSRDWKKRQRANKHKNIQPIIPSGFRCVRGDAEYQTADGLRKHYKETGH